MQIKLTNKLEHKNIFILNIVGISDFLMPHWELKIQTPSWTAHMAHTFLEPASLPGNDCWRQENISITAQMVLTSLWESRLPSSLPERVAAHHVRKSLFCFLSEGSTGKYSLNLICSLEGSRAGRGECWLTETTWSQPRKWLLGPLNSLHSEGQGHS